MILDHTQLQTLLSSSQRKSIENHSLRHAAVLVGLIEQKNETHFLLTRRTDFVETHKGQVSFPGGVIEKGEDAIAAAIRESEEEVGLKSEEICVLGLLDDMETPTGFVVTPVVAVINHKAELKSNEDEVARIFTAPVALFIGEKNVRTETRRLKGQNRLVYLYDFDGEVIWGVTAFIIRNFLEYIDGTHH